MTDSIPEPSDQMGLFNFDGAEGNAFWVTDPRDEDQSIPVPFDSLPTLAAFLQRNLPGLFPTLAAERQASAMMVADEETALYAQYPENIRWQDLNQSIHAVARRAFLAGEQSAVRGLSEQLSDWIEMRSDLVNSLSHVDETTDTRTLALRVMARLRSDPNWESVEYDDGEEKVDPEMVP